MSPIESDIPMILRLENPGPPSRDIGEARERHLSLLRCLQRMGFYDPIALIGPLPAEPEASAAEDTPAEQWIEPRRVA